MNLPGFNAEASLGRSERNYNSTNDLRRGLQSERLLAL
jgi:hypothetical protein